MPLSGRVNYQPGMYADREQLVMTVAAARPPEQGAQCAKSIVAVSKWSTWTSNVIPSAEGRANMIDSSWCATTSSEPSTPDLCGQ